MPAHRGDAPDLAWVSEACLRVAFGTDVSPATQARVHAAVREASSGAVPGLVEAVPAYASVLLVFDPAHLEPGAAEARVREALERAATPAAAPARTVEVPTCYEGSCAPDLDDVARHAGLSRRDTVRLHASATYVVGFLGFSPGFPYLHGLPERLAMPRLARPRPRVAAGSVAIAGRQAGVYPQATPGGWRIVGRTRLALFDARREPPALLAAGDVVQFVPIAHGEHEASGTGGA